MTPEFDRFVRPARARPAIWRLVLGVVAAFIVYMAFVSAFLFAAWRIAGREIPAFVWLPEVVLARTPRDTLILLGTFGGMALGAVAAARWLHGRRAGTLFGPGARTLRDFASAALVVFVVLGLSVAGWSLVYDSEPNLSPGTWLLLLPLALAGIALQTGAEEMLFRGYLQGQLAARFRSPAVWIVVPSLLFGIVHYDPESAGETALAVVGAASLFGLIAADLTARTGSIGAAWGFHFANNCVALLVLATDGTITGLALRLTPYTIDEIGAVGGLILVDLGMMVLAWLIVRRVVAR